MKNLIIGLVILALAPTACGQTTQTRQVDDLLTAYQKLGIFTGTALVYQPNKPILDKGYGYKDVERKVANDPNTIFQLASITKPVTSALVLKLVQLKKLFLTDKLSKFYPDFPGGTQITIENLLTHTSGIYDYTREATPVRKGGKKNMMAIFKSHELDFKPGSDWRYSNSGYSILGYIVQKVAAMSYEQAVRNYIFRPLQMNHSGFDFTNLKSSDKATGYSIYNDSLKVTASFSDSSVVFAAGAMYSTVGDLYRFHRALQTHQLLPRYLLEKAYKPFRHQYGYGWITDTVNGDQLVYHSGGISGFSSLLMRLPARDLCIILLNNKEGTELEPIGRTILKIINNEPYRIPEKRNPILLPDSVLMNYVGVFELTNPRLTIETTLANNKLSAHSLNGPTFELLAESEKVFGIAGQYHVKIEFVTDEKGTAKQLILTQNGQQSVGNKTN